MKIGPIEGLSVLKGQRQIDLQPINAHLTDSELDKALEEAKQNERVTSYTHRGEVYYVLKDRQGA